MSKFKPKPHTLTISFRFTATGIEKTLNGELQEDHLYFLTKEILRDLTEISTRTPLAELAFKTALTEYLMEVTDCENSELN